MLIRTYDAFSKPTPRQINRLADFLNGNLPDFTGERESIRKSLQYAIKEKAGLGGYIFVLESEDLVIGAMVLNRTGMENLLGTYLLAYIAIAENYRNQGHGTSLIEYARSYCKGSISVHLRPEGAFLPFFERLGFARLSEFWKVS